MEGGAADDVGVGVDDPSPSSGDEEGGTAKTVNGMVPLFGSKHLVNALITDGTITSLIKTLVDGCLHRLVLSGRRGFDDNCVCSGSDAFLGSSCCCCCC